ncbi:hypothetical protein RCOM_0847720 [Ricinus communis]|uniref:Uncharacterized protein n=1 Tax=Ricinus communis TaxID=3988 RepID=B9SL05_RICCO|nr:hypothetical protein RCOM_0847720 [Ricinus communis]
MDQILNKVGSYWLGQKANKELNSVGDDINLLGFLWEHYEGEKKLIEFLS